MNEDKNCIPLALNDTDCSNGLSNSANVVKAQIEARHGC